MATNLGYSGLNTQELVSTVQCGTNDIGNLSTTSVLLVPAPGLYSVTRVIRCEIQTRINTSLAPGAGAVLNVYYADGVGPVVATLPLADLTTLFTGGNTCRFATLLAKNATVALASNNVEIRLQLLVGNWTVGGNATDIMMVRTYYTLEPLIRVTY